MLTLVATYHLDLDFATICNAYADGLSTEYIQSLRESLLPHAKLLAKQVSAQWVMDAHREDMAGSMRQGDVTQPTDGGEPRSEVDIALPSTEPNVIQPGSEQPVPSPVAPTADAAEQPQ